MGAAGGTGASSNGHLAGGGANWNIDLDTDRVGVVLSNYDDLPEFGEILAQEQLAITG